MYEKVAIVTVSIEETVSLGQGERGPDRDSYFPRLAYIFHLKMFQKCRNINNINNNNSDNYLTSRCTDGKCKGYGCNEY